MTTDITHLNVSDILPDVERMPKDSRPIIEELEKRMLQQPQVECPINHVFLPGIYMREMHAPAGTLLLGHEHKTKHTCLLLKGCLQFRNENGTSTVLEAPMIFEGKPGRKAALALTDVVFCNLHATEETDVAKIEEQLITKSETWKAHQLEGAK